MILPLGIIKYYKMQRSRFRFKTARIDFAYVHLGASIGDFVVVAENSVVEKNCIIGRWTYIQSRCNINNASIGNFCALGNNVLIGSWQHSIDRFSISPKVYRYVIGGIGEKYNDTPRRTIIEDDVWIGSNATILDGVKIDRGAVVGANSVVTKDVPEYSVVAGNPARVIRQRLNKEAIDRLKKFNGGHGVIKR